MERLTHEADFGLEDWEETLFFVKSDPNGAYNIIDIAKYQGEPEFDEILKNVALRLSAIEDILGDEYDLDLVQKLIQAYKEGRYIIMKEPEQAGVSRLRELAQADREGRCVVLPEGGCEDKDGENALKSAMNTCFYHNNPVTRFIADAVAEKLTRQEAQAALRREQDGE